MAPSWRCRGKELLWGNRALLMGIVNVTPDSFSDGGKFYDTSDAIHHAYRLIDEGADLVDLGGASSRPGAAPVPWQEEVRRILPVVEEIAGRAGYFVSVDTFSYEVAARCLEAGACAINDISGLQQNPQLAELAADSGAGLVLVHMRGDPQTMQSLTEYEDLEGEIQSFFECQVKQAKSAGVLNEQIVLDPGIGFSKTADQNLQIVKNLRRVRFAEYPLLLGVSRKSFIGKITGADVENRLLGTAAAVAACVIYGANVLRVHDVKAMREVIAVVEAIERGSVSR